MPPMFTITRSRVSDSNFSKYVFTDPTTDGVQLRTDWVINEAIYKAGQTSEDSGEREDGPRDVDDDIVDADFEDLGENKRK